MQRLFESNFFDRNTYDVVLTSIAARAPDISGCQGAKFDARRMAITVEYIKRFGLFNGICLEIGTLNYISAQVIWSFFSDANVRDTSNDLRYEPLPAEDDSVDNAICLEVVEHISDKAYRHATQLDGLFFFLDELYRVLRVGGKCLITTPNAASFWAMTRIMSESTPMMYDWHFREYTMKELRSIVEYIGFEVIAHNAEYVWHLWDYTPLVDFCKANGVLISDRGDDQFLVIRKPEVRVNKPHNLNLPI